MRVCPHCNQTINEPANLDAIAETLSGQQKLVFNALRSNKTYSRNKYYLVHHLWTAKRQPDTALNIVSTTVQRLKLKLERYGWTITVNGRDFGETIYRLQAL